MFENKHGAQNFLAWNWRAVPYCIQRNHANEEESFRWNYSVEMLGYESVAGQHWGTKYGAEMEAVRQFLAKNGMEKDDDTSWREQIKFYGPKVNRA